MSTLAAQIDADAAALLALHGRSARYIRVGSGSGATGTPVTALVWQGGWGGGGAGPVRSQGPGRVVSGAGGGVDAVNPAQAHRRGTLSLKALAPGEGVTNPSSGVGDLGGVVIASAGDRLRVAPSVVGRADGADVDMVVAGGVRRVGAWWHAEWVL